MTNDYEFSEAERKFFTEQVAQLNALNAQINSNIRLVMLQRELEGNWRMRQDLSGLEQINAQVAQGLPLTSKEVEEQHGKHVNGVV